MLRCFVHLHVSEFLDEVFFWMCLLLLDVLVAMLVCELSQVVSTSSQHTAQSIFYPHSANSQLVMLGKKSNPINILPTSSLHVSNICSMGSLKISCGAG